MKIIVYVDGGFVIGAKTADPELRDIEVEVFDYDNIRTDDYMTGKQLAKLVKKSEEENPFTITVSDIH